MQLQSFFLLALATAALALPAEIIDDKDSVFNETLVSHRLEKRATHGWLSSYADSDPQCLAGYAPPRPKVRHACIKFRPAENTISVGSPIPYLLSLFQSPT